MCVAIHASQPIALHVQVDEKLTEHGGVRVTYKAAIHDADADPHNDEWLPKTETSEGKRVTDPKGIMFMTKDLKVDLSLAAQPEHWLHGDLRDAEGLSKKDVWRKSKVMSDILIHRMSAFTPEQQDQWRALNKFHELYKVSDEVPDLPLTLRAGTRLTAQTDPTLKSKACCVCEN